MPAALYSLPSQDLVWFGLGDKGQGDKGNDSMTRIFSFSIGAVMTIVIVIVIAHETKRNENDNRRIFGGGRENMGDSSLGCWALGGS